jgi:serine protease Do
VSASPYTAAVNQTTQPTASSSSYGNYGYGTSEYSSAQPAAPAHAIAPAHAEPAGKRRGLGVGLVLVCLIVSLASGFGGAKLAAYLEPVEETTPPTVIYQEVENTGVDATTTVSDIVATVEDSVVAITTETVVFSGWMGSAVQEGAGSGVIVSQDGYVVTNYHVINGARAIAVHLADGTDAQARLVGGDQANDLAVLKIESAGLQAAVMGSSSTLVVGQTAIAIGNPLGELGGTVTSGIISALDREITIEGQAMTLIQTDTAINPGNSGGGLFDLNGSLIGVVNAKSSGSDIEGLGFAIPIDDARPIVEQIIATDPGR